MKTALVISGGGSKGAFAVGVLRYIHDHVRKLDEMDIYCGTSTGALITPLAMQGEEGLLLLERLYTTTTQNDVLRMGNIQNLIDPRAPSLHDATPLKNLINRTLTAVQLQRILNSGKPLFASTVCLQTQKLVYFCTQRAASTRDYDVITIRTEAEWERVMLASSCQPVFMQPIEVQVGSLPLRQYNDGGVRELTPMQAAVDSGASTIFAITVSPATEQRLEQKFSSAFNVLERTLDMFSEDVSHNDYRVSLLYRDVNLYVDQVKVKLRQLGLSENQINAALQAQNNPLIGKPLRIVHEIRPAQTLTMGGTGGLRFDPASMQQMRQMGRERAKAYFEGLAGSGQPVVV